MDLLKMTVLRCVGFVVEVRTIHCPPPQVHQGRQHCLYVLLHSIAIVMGM